MKKFIELAGIAACLFLTSACSGSGKSDAANDSANAHNDSKVFVAYFSATGTTAKAAKEVAEATGGRLYEITPVKPYTDADLDYENENSRSALENQDTGLRPEIKEVPDLSDYNTIYVGFPVWWDKAPLVIDSFFDSQSFEGKKIIIFATSHTSGLGPSLEKLQANYSRYDIEGGAILTATNSEDFNHWLASLKSSSNP